MIKMAHDTQKRQRLIKNKQPRICTCGCKMAYSAFDGAYNCINCGNRELDLYGRMKEAVEAYPNISKMELSALLGEPLKNLTPYIEDGRLVNKDIY